MLKREAEALEVAEAAHARALLDLLAESTIDIRQELTKEQRQREDDLFRRISAIENRIWQEGLPAAPERQLKAELVKTEGHLEAFSNFAASIVVMPAFSIPNFGLERIQRDLLDGGYGAHRIPPG